MGDEGTPVCFFNLKSPCWHEIDTHEDLMAYQQNVKNSIRKEGGNNETIFK